MPLGRRPFRPIATAVGSHYGASVRAFALVELGDSESIDLFLREEDAKRALAKCLGDDPDWTLLLHVVPIELPAYAGDLLSYYQDQVANERRLRARRFAISTLAVVAILCCWQRHRPNDR
jgi:hypothetical protein